MYVLPECGVGDNTSRLCNETQTCALSLSQGQVLRLKTVRAH